MNPISYFLVKAAAKIIAVDDTVVPYEQLEVLQDMLKASKIEFDGNDARKLLHNVACKHLVNGITVLKTNSNLVFSSTGNGTSEAEAAASLVKFLNSSGSRLTAFPVRKQLKVLDETIPVRAEAGRSLSSAVRGEVPEV